MTFKHNIERDYNFMRKIGRESTISWFIEDLEQNQVQPQYSIIVFNIKDLNFRNLVLFYLFETWGTWPLE
jgi:hypothetical protein